MDMYVMNGTNQVGPMNGQFYELYEEPEMMQGTNQVMPMQGTNQVVPLQGVGGGVYEIEMLPLALMDESDVPMQGIPDDYTDEDIEIYRLAYLAGDNDAMQGLFKRLKGKIQQARAGNKAARQDRREEREARQELRQQARVTRQQKRASGQGFFDRVGGFLGNLGEAKRIAAEAGAALDDAGIDYDDEVLEQRAALAADAGATAGDTRMTRSSEGGAGAGGGGVVAWWQARSMPEKVVIGVGGLLLGYAGYKVMTGQPIFGKKKGGKK